MPDAVRSAHNPQHRRFSDATCIRRVDASRQSPPPPAPFGAARGIALKVKKEKRPSRGSARALGEFPRLVRARLRPYPGDSSCRCLRREPPAGRPEALVEGRRARPSSLKGAPPPRDAVRCVAHPFPSVPPQALRGAMSVKAFEPVSCPCGSHPCGPLARIHATRNRKSTRSRRLFRFPPEVLHAEHHLRRSPACGWESITSRNCRIEISLQKPTSASTDPSDPRTSKRNERPPSFTTTS